MCYHNSIIKDAKALEARYNATFGLPNRFTPLYHANGRNFPKTPVITSANPSAINLYNWGLIPSHMNSREAAMERRTATLNARAETIFQKESYAIPIMTKRCLIVSTGFYDWQDFKKKKYPYYIKLKTAEIFSFGGIHDEWVDQDTGEIFETYSIVTTEANPLMARIHNLKKRMPLIFDREMEKEWLNPTLDKKQIMELMAIFPDKDMVAYTISKLITSR